MSKLIPQSFIDDLLSRVDITDIVGSRIKLKRTGNNLLGLCPFHNEKTPSFTVSSTKQFFHCFGCGTHGSAITFMMEFEHIGFIEAVESLAVHAGLTVPKTSDPADKIRYTELYSLMEKAATLFEKQLPKSKGSIEYLKSRGFTGQISKHFRIGVATNEWDNLQPIYGISATTKQQMITTGLLIEKNGKVYSRFRNRIMFPIRNTRGNIIGFGGRTLNKDDPAKYLNSPETPIFHKGEELYGLYEAKKAIRNLTSLIVVEGYLDVIALAQFDIKNAVATLGTAISTKQIQLLLRNSSEIVFCFDGDRAGKTAAWRGLENSLPLMRDGIQIKFMFLPDGDDPDSLIRKEGTEAFKERIKTSVPLSNFFIDQLLSTINIDSIDGKAKLTKIGRQLLGKMPHGIFYQLLSDKIAQLANINPEELGSQDIPKFSKKPNEIYDNQRTLNIEDIPIPVQSAINILLHNPQFISHIEDKDIDNIRNININGIKILLELLNLIKDQANITIGAILEHWRDRQELELLSKMSYKEPLIPKEILKNELSGIIRFLEQFEREQLIQNLLAKASNGKLSQEERKELQTLIESSKK